LTKDEKKLSKFHFDGRFFNVDEHLVNDLETVTERALPVIKEIKRLLLAHGAAGAMMSGSGSTVFGLFADRSEPFQRIQPCVTISKVKTGRFMSRIY
jgi:4-diphosphocytidyl-2-C-methyl-D-erythritol kinase